MGAGNVKLALSRWGHLPGRAPQLLAWMAARSKDTDEVPVYYASQEDLALALGRVLPDAPRDDDGLVDEERAAIERLRRAAFEALKGPKRVLIEAGAIRRTRAPSPRSTARYELILRPETTQGEPAPNTAGDACPDGVRSGDNTAGGACPEQGRLASPNGAGARPQTGQAGGPPEEEEDDRGQGRRTHRDGRNQTSDAREPARDEDDPRDYEARARRLTESRRGGSR